ncbi:MAG: TetR-like C-terminal domain-containing protein [Acutalibacteraceae bacterium]|nr:TetR-like C-terminal domain-containing protein [Acutalibacteraceae bacterium]
MPPKFKVTKEDIINTAAEIVRKSGAQSLNARNIASALNCSTQPVFSNFSSMEQLRLAVVEKADKLCREYMKNEMEKGEYPDYKANGMAYIRFAKEEKELFKLLYMRDRAKEKNLSLEITDEMESMVHNNTGLTELELKLFHLEMWAYVHGIAVMFATGFVELEWEIVSKMLTDSYQGLRKQYGVE